MGVTKETEARGSQIYIGTPNGIVLCADGGAGDQLRGRFYHFYSRDAVHFENADQLIFEMEKFFDSIHFPHPGTHIRSFTEEGRQKRRGRRTAAPPPDEAERQKKASENIPIGKREKVMKDQELLSKHGDMGSFIIRVQQRQNSSMQGRLTWVEKNKTVYFRSVWELIRLIDSAVELNNPSSGEEMPSWEE